MLMQRLVASDVEVARRNRNRVMRLLEKLHDGDDVVPGRTSSRYQTVCAWA